MHILMGALSDANFRFAGPKVCGLVGANGSGKTTVLLSLLGLIKPDAGSVTVLGRDTRSSPTSELARQVGYVFQNPDHQLFADSVWDEAAFAPRNFGLWDEPAATRIEQLLDRCGLNDRRADHPYRLSYGEKRRLNLVSALGHDPALILLDEPSNGLDVMATRSLREIILKLKDTGRCVLFSSHVMQEVAALCDDICIIANGQVAIDDSIDGIRQRTGCDDIEDAFVKAIHMVEPE